MTTTTDYGTWNNRADRYALTVEQTVEEAFGSEGPEGFDFDAIVRDYRTAINSALPEGITLAGDEFIGPWPRRDIDIAEIVRSVDLWSIIEGHATAADDDPDDDRDELSQADAVAELIKAIRAGWSVTDDFTFETVSAGGQQGIAMDLPPFGQTIYITVDIQPSV